jgi:hypothetical protein
MASDLRKEQTMKVQLKYPRVLMDGSESSKQHCVPGKVYDLSDKVMNHHYTKALVKAGEITAVLEVKDEESKLPTGKK